MCVCFFFLCVCAFFSKVLIQFSFFFSLLYVFVCVSLIGTVLTFPFSFCQKSAALCGSFVFDFDS